MHIVSLNVGRPQIVVRHGRRYSTAFDRRPADAPVLLSVDGFEGDRVSDSRAHGGPDKAACCYPLEHYAYFGERLGAELSIPSFGENLTTAGLLESDVCIGDVFRAGQARVQISQPRQPCEKLALRHGHPALPRWVNESRFTGFYFRVVEGGPVAAGDAIVLLDRPHGDWTVARATQIVLADSPDREELARLAALPPLSAAWRRRIRRRLGIGEDMGDE